MSSFTTDPRLDFIGNYRFRLAEPFEYHVGEYPSAEVIVVPVGFETDFASVPRPLWWLFPPYGPWAKAAIIHDRLYSTREKTREECDNIFLEAMAVLSVPVVTRKLMYWAVRLFGRAAYKG